MTSWSRIPLERRELLESLVAEYAQHYSRGRTLLGVDGADGSGKTRFADDLALAFRRAGLTVVRASIDDFHRPRALRYARGRLSPEGGYLDTYDYSLFRRVLVEPFRLGGSTGFEVAPFDLERDVPRESDWVTAPADAILLVDGRFLNRPELRGIWHFTIFLEAGAATRHARMIVRDGLDPDPAAPLAMRYTGAFQRYLADGDPRAAATVVIDIDDYDRPKRVFRDEC